MNEEKIISIIGPNIERCRPGDWEHAQRVVRWVKELGVGREDLELLIVAGYVHDIGWRDIVSKDKLTFEKLLEMEPQANQNSEPYVREVLTQLEYNDSQINKVLKLVSAADKHGSENDDEEIIVDADQLSKLDIDHLKDKFQKTEWLKMYEIWKDNFDTRIKTRQAKALYPDLLKSLEASIKESL